MNEVLFILYIFSSVVKKKHLIYANPMIDTRYKIQDTLFQAQNPWIKQ